MMIMAVVGAFSLSGAAQEKKAYIVSNAHFDSQWNWDVQTSIREFIPKTLDRNLMLLEKYPDYVFNFEGGVKYQWMKEYYPMEYERMKQYVKEGRWHVTGSTWDATDVLIPSPESLTRNILYGQRFFRKELGVESTDIFLPDCFGFGWTLPTIAAHSGLIGFSTQKLQWRQHPFYGNRKIPFEIGLWKGVDGSRIMLVADARNYTTKWPDTDLSRSPELLKIIDESPLNVTYHYYGTGDTGGSPTIESVRAVQKGVNGQGPVKIISATSDRIYKDFLPFSAHPELPVFDGELLMDVHGTGCYTSQAAMKLYNRRNELLADVAERAAVAADRLKVVAYPQELLTEAWKRFIWHQFHDDLTGTSIPRAYEFSRNDELISMKQFASVLQSSVGAVSRGLDTQVKGLPLVVFNPSSFPADDLLEVNFTLPAKAGHLAVFDARGNEVPSRTVAVNGNRVTMLIGASVAPLGLEVFDIRMQKPSVAAPVVRVSDREIENSVYKVSLDEHGDIASIVDKRNGQELVEKGKAVRLALFTENESYRWPAWEILKKTVDGKPVPVTGNVTIRKAEEGALRGAICVERTYGDSRFKQYIRLNEGGQRDRIDLVNEIDWHTTNALLKAEFPLTVANEKAVYDLGIGSVERGNNTKTAYEVYAQQWADLTAADGSYGVSVMNDCKYGWDKPADNVIRLTLLHTPKTSTNYAYQDRQDFGRHRFTYSIVGHAGRLRRTETTRRAEMLNQTPVAFIAPKHKGPWGRSLSLGTLDSGNVLLRTMKKAEDNDGYILRFYETGGEGSEKVNFTLPADILSAEEVNGVEDKLGDAVFSGRTLTFSILPNGIKSFKVKLAEPGNRLPETASACIDLPFDTKAASYNAFRREVNFDGRGHSFAAELFPETLSYRGVTFRLGEPDARNALKCRKQTIALPQGNFDRLYLLAASASTDLKAVFKAGRSEQPVVVPSYTGFIGHWGTDGYLKHAADPAFVGTHRHSMLQNADLPYEYTYMFCVALDIPKGASTLELPDCPALTVFAATAVEEAGSRVTPAVDLLKVDLPDKEAEAADEVRRNLLLNVPVMEKSGEIHRRERAELAVDEDIETKWCDVGQEKAKYIAFDLGAEKDLKGWQVFHASLESLDYTTKEYALQVKNRPEEDWITVDTVADNVAIETDRLLPKPVRARYVRLYITKPDQSEGRTARIYEFSVY